MLAPIKRLIAILAICQKRKLEHRMASGCISLPCISLALEMLVGNGQSMQNSEYCFPRKSKLKLTSQKIPLTPLVLEGEINAVFLKDYVFSVFPDPVPMFGTLFVTC